MKFTLCSRDPCKLNHILKAFLLTDLLGCCVHGSSGQLAIIPDVPVARVGQTVTLYIHHMLRARSAAWYKGRSPVSEANRILNYSFENTNIVSFGPWYNEKEAALPDGSLRIKNVVRNHTGYYTVQIQLMDGATTSNASVEIGVYDVLTPPTLAQTSESSESGNEYMMQCQAGGQQVERYSFFKDAMNVTCDQQRINCSEPSSFLSFHPIKESDSGRYTCTIYNPVSLNTSLPLGIIVRAVPISTVTISSNVTSGGLLWEYEDSVQLTCAAQGTEPVFSWMHNRGVLPQNSRFHLSADNSSLTISPVIRGDTELFHCTASNSANNESSDTLQLAISWRPMGLIQCTAVDSSNVSETLLHCSWPDGSPPATVTLIHPKANGTGNNEVTVSISQSSLMRGTEMSCNGNQEGHIQSCSLFFELPYDPNYQEDHIVSATEGEDVSLEVNLKQSSRSVDVLPATFRWFINSSLSFPSDELVLITFNQTFSKLRNFRVTEKSAGDYRCEAVNLMGTTNFSFAVLTTKSPVIRPVSTELFGGAIAGIVVGIAALLVLTGVGAFFVGRRSREQKPRQNKRLDPTKSQPEKPMRKHTPIESVYANLENPSVYSNYENMIHKAVYSNYENMIHKAQ